MDVGELRLPPGELRRPGELPLPVGEYVLPGELVLPPGELVRPIGLPTLAPGLIEFCRSARRASGKKRRSSVRVWCFVFFFHRINDMLVCQRGWLAIVIVYWSSSEYGCLLVWIIVEFQNMFCAYNVWIKRNVNLGKVPRSTLFYVYVSPPILE